MWAYESVFYQIYPLGFCGAPFENDGCLCHRISKVEEWIPHMKKLGISAIYFSPVFESDTHGYNTRDYQKIDCRLGTNEDFARLCRHLHEEGVRVVIDGVFNHAGRGFWAFQDVLRHRETSRYRDWFYLNFQGDSPYHDGLWYEGWEGNYDLVKLNLDNAEVRDYLFSCIRGWIKEFDIDGLRLDVAYCLKPEFLRELRAFCDSLKPDFFLLGELLHGDYNRWVGEGMLHSATNYECYKGLYSSFNSMNLFEIMHSLKRQFGPEQWTLYKGKHLLSFVDNHDVSRIASVLQMPQHLPLIYALMFAMPGIPCVYYGSEWGAKGDKREGDPALRVSFEYPQFNALSEWISALAAVKKHSEALCYGDFQDVLITNRQCVFARNSETECVWTLINADSEPYLFHTGAAGKQAYDLIDETVFAFTDELVLEPYSARLLRVEKG